jgi:hypothetical protein
VPASTDERRYFVLDVAGTRMGDRAYFAAIENQMQAGGAAAMLHALQHRDISRFEIRDIPGSQALADQKKHSLDTLDRWWLAVLERGFVWRSRHGLPVFGEWQEFVSTELLNRAYLQWCSENRVQRPMTRVQLGARMTEVYTPKRPDGSGIIGEVEVATRTDLGTSLIAGDLVIKVARPPATRWATLPVLVRASPSSAA